MSQLKMVEYIWLDGNTPTCKIRSKTRCIYLPENPQLTDFPDWGFDGSSTEQAQRTQSDCLLQPICFVHNPIAEESGYLVLCEVYEALGKEHPSNSRFYLRKVLEEGGELFNPWVGFEQEYTMFRNNIPLGWPEHGYPAPQGPYYCGIGSEQIFGRKLAREHARCCIEAGLMYYGMNAEVMPGQWEFQIGYRGLEDKSAPALKVADHTWIARWLLHRLSENYNVHISLDNKPVKGDWNGAGLHTNFSTEAMRSCEQGKKSITSAVQKLNEKHPEHIAIYGENLGERLTGKHETSSILRFSSGSTDRGRSIRIPLTVLSKGHGYLEDRRPGANADPYLVAAKLISTICDIPMPNGHENWYNEEYSMLFSRST